MKKDWDNCGAARREFLKNSHGVVFWSQNGRQRAVPESGPHEMKARPENRTMRRETKKAPDVLGLGDNLRRMSSARRGARKRPDPKIARGQSPGRLEDFDND